MIYTHVLKEALGGEQPQILEQMNMWLL